MHLHLYTIFHHASIRSKEEDSRPNSPAQSPPPTPSPAKKKRVVRYVLIDDSLMILYLPFPLTITIVNYAAWRVSSWITILTTQLIGMCVFTTFSRC